MKRMKAEGKRNKFMLSVQFCLLDYCFCFFSFSSQKGHTNEELQVQASVSEDGNQILCGSDDQNVYLWETHPSSFASSVAAHSADAECDRNDEYEYWHAHESRVTCAIFAPRQTIQYSAKSPEHAKQVSHMIVTAGRLLEVSRAELR
jgi:hypothetical protein